MVNFNDRWTELAPKNVYSSIKNDNLLVNFLPMDQIEKGKMTDWNYFWGVCGTLRTSWSNQYIK